VDAVRLVSEANLFIEAQQSTGGVRRLFRHRGRVCDKRARGAAGRARDALALFAVGTLINRIEIPAWSSRSARCSREIA